MSGRFLLDTNTVIALLKGESSIAGTIRQAEWLGISVITVIEYHSFSGLEENDRALFSRFLERVFVVDLIAVDEPFIRTICELRIAHRIKTPDAIILASALKHEAILVTADTSLDSVWNRITSR